MEWRKDKNQLVVYSLGNFVSGQRDRYKNGGAMARLELMKISNTDSSATTIDSAGYILQWVYRTNDSKKDYYVLPVPTFENDTTGFIVDDYSRKAFQTFIDDSRKLFSKSNIMVSEEKNIPISSAEEITKEDDCLQPDSCYIKPDPGLCKAYIVKYYYDAVEKKCKEFIWGGCGGVVPFETLEDCKTCECEPDKE
jgi:hypothetical protein